MRSEEANQTMHVSKRQRLDIYVEELAGTTALNADILAQYRAGRDAADVRRSHWFGGRFENIYLGVERVPALAPVLKLAREGARRFLGRPDVSLVTGFWFNDMGPGQRTLMHDHDEDKELVSAVYYVDVPPDSGELVLYQGLTKTVVSPRAGCLVYFRPDLPHEVTENRSGSSRLSVGMNFLRSGDAVDE